MRSVRRHQQPQAVHRARSIGHKITARRAARASTSLLRLDGADVLVVHLGMSGQLLRAKTARDEGAEAHARRDHVHAGRAAALRRPAHVRRDVRHRRTTTLEKQVDELAHLGLDPLETAMSWELLRPACSRSARRKLKALLMDQKFIAGIGNIYSDEILFGAGLRWDRMSDSLSQQEVRRLYRAIDRDAAGRGEVPRLVARRRAVRRPVRPAGRVPAPPPGVRPRRARRARGAGAPLVRERVLEPLHLLLRGVSGLTPTASPRRACRRHAGACRACGSATSCREQARALGVARLGAQPGRRRGRGRVRGPAGRGRPDGRVVPRRPAAGAGRRGRGRRPIAPVGEPGFHVR